MQSESVLAGWQGWHGWPKVVESAKILPALKPETGFVAVTSVPVPGAAAFLRRACLPFSADRWGCLSQGIQKISFTLESGNYIVPIQIVKRTDIMDPGPTFAATHSQLRLASSHTEMLIRLNQSRTDAHTNQSRSSKTLTRSK